MLFLQIYTLLFILLFLCILHFGLFKHSESFIAFFKLFILLSLMCHPGQGWNHTSTQQLPATNRPLPPLERCLMQRWQVPKALVTQKADIRIPGLKVGSKPQRGWIGIHQIFLFSLAEKILTPLLSSHLCFGYSFWKSAWVWSCNKTWGLSAEARGRQLIYQYHQCDNVVSAVSGWEKQDAMLNDTSISSVSALNVKSFTRQFHRDRNLASEPHSGKSLCSRY